MKTYTVYYRTGGTDNFQWKRCSAVATKEEAIASMQEIERGGRVAHYTYTHLLDSIGLPDTYDAGDYPSYMNDPDYDEFTITSAVDEDGTCHICYGCARHAAWCCVPRALQAIEANNQKVTA